MCEQIEKELSLALRKWEAENGRPFLVDGRRYLDCMYGEKALASLKRVRSEEKSWVGAMLGMVVLQSSWSVSRSAHTGMVHMVVGGSRSPPSSSWICRVCRPVGRSLLSACLRGTSNSLAVAHHISSHL